MPQESIRQDEIFHALACFLAGAPPGRLLENGRAVLDELRVNESQRMVRQPRSILPEALSTYCSDQTWRLVNKE
jgi:hypothetical protein